MRLIFIVFFAFLAASCASTQPLGGGSDVVVAQQQSLPDPTRRDLYQARRPYLIGSFDKLAISVFGVEDLSGEFQIDAGGKLSFPLIGVISAAGQSPQELGVVIAERLRGNFVRDPQVTVNLVSTVSQVITVDGQVKEPGLYPVIGEMTLMRAVATAGGTTEFAKLQDVVIFRAVDGQQYVGLYNLKGIRRGNYSDPEVFPNDVIVIGDSSARRLFKDVIQGSSLITTPLILLSRLGN